MLEKVDTLKYMGSVLSLNDINWTGLDRNLHILWSKQGQFFHMLFQEGEDIRTSGRFLVAVV